MAAAARIGIRIAERAGAICVYHRNSWSHAGERTGGENKIRRRNSIPVIANKIVGEEGGRIDHQNATRIDGVGRYPGDGRSGYVCDLHLTAHANRARNQTWRAEISAYCYRSRSATGKNAASGKKVPASGKIAGGRAAAGSQFDRARAGRNISTGIHRSPNRDNLMCGNISARGNLASKD